MSKTTVLPITVSIAGQQPTPLYPARHRTRVQPIATSIVGYDQTITMYPTGLVTDEATLADPMVSTLLTSITSISRQNRPQLTSKRADPTLRSGGRSA